MRYWLAIAIGVGFLLSILPNTYAQENIFSPLKQFKSGIPVQDIKCKEGFVLIIKVNGDPTCVKPASVSRLVLHGWITLEKFETVHPIILQQNETGILIQKQNTTNQSIIQQNETNIISNQTSTDNSTLNVINGINQSSSIAQFSVKPLPEITTTPEVSITKPEIKILAIGMSPNPLKVGDKPQFTVTYQNISDKPIWRNEGCQAHSPFLYTILPSSNVNSQPRPQVGSLCPEFSGYVEPNQIATDYAESYPPVTYQIIKSGTLSITMNFDEGDGSVSGIQATVQFNVNATDTVDLVSDTSNTTGSTILLSPGITTPTISATKPGIKILSIEMSPDPLKVGDQPGFTLTWQNISNRTFYNTDDGCGISSLGATITPEDHVSVIHPTRHLMCAVHSYLVHPGQISTNSAMADPDHAQLNSNGRFLAFYSASYMVVKPGTLNVIMNLYVGNDQGKYELTETIQFNITAIQ